MATVSLRRNFTWTFAANVIYALCQWLMLVVLAQAGTTSMVGQFGLALAITAPIVLFANLGLRQLQATDARGEFCISFLLRAPVGDARRCSGGHRPRHCDLRVWSRDGSGCRDHGHRKVCRVTE